MKFIIVIHLLKIFISAGLMRVHEARMYTNVYKCNVYIYT